MPTRAKSFKEVREFKEFSADAKKLRCNPNPKFPKLSNFPKKSYFSISVMLRWIKSERFLPLSIPFDSRARSII